MHTVRLMDQDVFLNLYKYILYIIYIKYMNICLRMSNFMIHKYLKSNYQPVKTIIFEVIIFPF